MTKPTPKDSSPKAKSDPKIQHLEQALVAWHKTLPSASRGGSNPHFRSSYSTLEEVIAVAETATEFGITFTQLTDFTVIEGGVIEYVKTWIIHESGERLEARTLIKAKDKSNPQQMGSGITYAKRYGLQAALGIPSEDDVANAATKPKVEEVVEFGNKATNNDGGW